MNTVISMLLQIVCTFFVDSIEYSIAYTILCNINHIQEYSAEKIAEMANVSTRSLSNFSKKLGYRNYAMLKSGILSTIEVRKMQIANHVQFSDDNSLINIINSLGITEFDKEAFIKSVDKYNEYVSKANKVLIVGAVYPELLSLHYMEDMIIAGKTVYAKSLYTDLENIPEDTLVLFISFTGRMYKAQYHRIKEMKDNNIVIFGIGNKDSLTDGIKLNGFIELPFNVDAEEENAVLPLVLQYAKLRYIEVEGKKYVGL